jgi:hypothetical protein
MKIEPSTALLCPPVSIVVLILPLLCGISTSFSAEKYDFLRESLTLHASFDDDLTADFAKGDPELYTMTASRPEVKNEVGLHANDADLVHQKKSGRFGDCLHFKTTSAPRVFYQVEKNLSYTNANWQGTVSFWLRTTPDEDLEPGYTDPIQITPRSALDACFFFEFGIEDPRPCRLGVFPDKLAWNPENKPNKEIPIPERPLIEVQKAPFSREKWTHIVFTWENFNNGDDKGVAKLYLDGKPSGEMDGWNQQYTWDLALAQIRLGVKFIGGFDELSCFDRALTEEEIEGLHQLPNGVTGILKRDNQQAILDAVSQVPLFDTVDLNVGEATELKVGGPSVKLIAVKEPKGEVWGEIAQPEVTVEVNGETATLVAGVYRLPTVVGGMQVDCPITGGLKKNSHIDHWALEKDARLRVWPSPDSPWIAPGSFGYPVKQQWFASQTSFSNEPVAPRPNGQLYYHAGLDIGGCEELVEIVAATDALIVSVGNKILPGHEPAAGSPVDPRYDVLYLLDERGWYYRYSHLHSFAEELLPGMRVELGDSLGRLGKEGGSGGWTHLHFEIKARQPSGEWGTQEGYAFLWQGYHELYAPEIIAVARPGHVLFAGDSVTHDGLRSWSKRGTIEQYAWTFSDETRANTPTAEKTYPNPGTYMETLQVTDDTGATDYDFVRAKVFGRDADGKAIDPPRLHATFHPTLEPLRAGQPVTFKVRAFNTTHGEETWDFGDGSPTQNTQSDGNVEQRAKDGYAVIEHSYAERGDYLVHVWRKDEHGQHAEDRLHVRVSE